MMRRHRTCEEAQVDPRPQTDVLSLADSLQNHPICGLSGAIDSLPACLRLGPLEPDLQGAAGSSADPPFQHYDAL